MKSILVAFVFFLASCGSEKPMKTSFDMETYLSEMPKAELHLHLEGTLSPQTIVEMTNRNNIEYFRTVEEIQRSLAARPPGLMGFLEHHFKMQEVMRTGVDFYNATYNLARELDENNIVYVDLFFDPQAHTTRGIAFSDIIENIDRARKDAAGDFGLQMNLIMCIQRERSVESAFEMLAQAEPYQDRIIGLGMDSGPEYGNPPVKFKDVYKKARELGYRLTGHHDVDVQDSVKHIWQSLDVIGMDRIDHGLNASDAPELMNALVDRNICLTGSPVKRKSDPQLQDIDRLTVLMEAGVCVSLNSDDPAEFESGYLSEIMIRFQSDSDFTAEKMTRFMLNAFRSLWLEEEQKKIYIDALESYSKQHGVDWQEVLNL